MSDLISREQAIETFKDCAVNGVGIDGIVDALEQLQPIQPEIVRCKDCKHRDPEDKKCDCGHDILWQLPRRNDWFCADGER